MIAIHSGDEWHFCVRVIKCKINKLMLPLRQIISY
jgi:hypothetical protein